MDQQKKSGRDAAKELGITDFNYENENTEEDNGEDLPPFSNNPLSQNAIVGQEKRQIKKNEYV